MLPIRDDNPHFLSPLVTLGLIGLNVLTWVTVQGFGLAPGALEDSVCMYGLIPAELLQVDVRGARQAFCPLGPSSWSDVVTSMFMHGGWGHILGNMWFLWIFGNNVEDSMGHVRFATFYLLCGVAAAACQLVADPVSTLPMVGASGAIGGVMGAYVVLYPRVRVHMLVMLGFYITTIAVPAMWMLGYWFVVQLLGGWTSAAGEGGVAFWAHIGGFAAGAALVFVFRDPRLLAHHPYRGWSGGSRAERSWRV
jgi:membrane associated rhomboid family serine protease